MLCRALTFNKQTSKIQNNSARNRNRTSLVDQGWRPALGLCSPNHPKPMLPPMHFCGPSSTAAEHDLETSDLVHSLFLTWKNSAAAWTVYVLVPSQASYSICEHWIWTLMQTVSLNFSLLANILIFGAPNLFSTSQHFSWIDRCHFFFF